MECESKRNSGINTGDRNRFKTTPTVPGQHNRKAQNQGSTKNDHGGHCTHTAEGATVKVQNIFHGRNNIMCSTNRKYRMAATLCTLETWFGSGI